MHDFTQVQSGSAILWNTIKVYLANLHQLALIAAIPLFPAFLWQEYAIQSNLGISLPTLVAVAASVVASLPCAVALSEICLGNRPSVLRAYGRLLDGAVGKMLLTYLMYVVPYLLCMLLVIPVFFFEAWYMFVLPVVVLEGQWGFAAFKRSAALSRGFRGRNIGLQVLVSLQYFTLIVLGRAAVDQLIPLGADPLLPSILKAWISILLFPPMLTVTILLYLDMRARKEASDNEPIVEDLLR
jgi:hypothetical protein